MKLYHAAGKRVIYVPWKRDVIVATPKVAQTSIRMSIGNHAQTSDPAAYDRRIVFVRDPLERLESTYHYFRNRGGFPSGWSQLKQRMVRHAPTTIEEFINLILDNGWGDKHWIPQSELWGVEDPTCYDFEDLGKELRNLGINIQHHNASGIPKSGISYRLPELEDLYKEDLAARERIYVSNVCMDERRP